MGDEPEDEVTNEYNSAMKRILPTRGIRLVEIPRMEGQNGVISASNVRKCLENHDLEEVESLIPETTKNILFWKNE